ncbi:transcription factor bHLH110-like [Typha latifolia]|uniref:transcription factor bHLH110-like n=1 Tax=Typha latifolia TaxID=4733 RepID=UPI003C2C9B8C
MMGSSNQEELIHGSSSLPPAAAPPFHGVGVVSNNYEWNQPLMLNCGDFTSDVNEAFSSIQRDHDINPTPPLSSLLLQDLGLQWDTGNADSFMNHPGHLPKIKQELSAADTLFTKLNEHYQLDEKLLLRSTYPLENSHSNGLQPPAGDSLYNQASFAFDLPSAMTARLSLPPLPLPGAADMNVHALHLLASARMLGRSFCQPSWNGMALLREGINYGPSHLQEAVQGVLPTSCSHHMVPSLVSGVTEARATNIVEHKASQTVHRKPRFESRSSFSSFKVRKEKLGDRIAALQQLVAPFGKTDTASVLMEAIGYIKFLQDQVETLSVPYRRPSNNKKLRTMQGVANEEKDMPKLDLRSRGLCLVPLSCTSYVTNENGGVW